MFLKKKKQKSCSVLDALFNQITLDSKLDIPHPLRPSTVARIGMFEWRLNLQLPPVRLHFSLFRASPRKENLRLQNSNKATEQEKGNVQIVLMLTQIHFSGEVVPKAEQLYRSNNRTRRHFSLQNGYFARIFGVQNQYCTLLAKKSCTRITNMQ